MCFSKDAPLYALYFLYVHLFVFTFRTGRSAFAKEVKPFGLLYCVAWIMMETFDYALWKAREDGEGACYGLVNVAGVLTIVPTIGVFNAMIWYKRGKGMQALDDWDARVFFLDVLAMGAVLVALSENDSVLIPSGPWEGTNVFGTQTRRNYWWSE